MAERKLHSDAREHSDQTACQQSKAQTGAQIIVRSLIEQGVDVVFGIPGGQVLDIYDELYKHADQIRHVISAHEQGAAHAADGYARATGKVGVCIATSGPGATNLVTGIAAAHMDSTPMVVITGNVPTRLLGKDSFQEIDIFGVTLPIVKQNYIVKNINELSQVLAEAFALAQSGRCGPVLVDVPSDVQTARCTHTNCIPLELSNATNGNASFSLEDLNRGAQLIVESERPFVYCGGGVLAANAGSEVVCFAECIDAAIGCSMMGLTAIPASHPRNLGMTGMHGHEAAIRAMSNADLVIAVGARFSDRATGNKEHFTKGKKFIHVDIDPAEIDKNVKTDVALVGDIKEILGFLQDVLPHEKHTVWLTECESLQDKLVEAHVLGDRFDPSAIIRSVREQLSDETIVVTDVGQHQLWVAQNYAFERPRTFLTSGGLGAMGFGMGAAIGASLSAAGGKGSNKLVLFTGDGSFGMNCTELATAVSERLPLIIIILNNGLLGMVHQWQELFYEQRYSNTVIDRKTDFVRLALAFGADGRCARNLSEFNLALSTALTADGPFVIDCTISKDEKVFPMIPPGGTINTMLLG